MVDDDDLDERAETELDAVVETDNAGEWEAVPTILETVSVKVPGKDGGTVMRAESVTVILGERDALLQRDSRDDLDGDVDTLALTVTDPEADEEAEDDEDSLIDSDTMALDEVDVVCEGDEEEELDDDDDFVWVVEGV